MIRLCLQRMAVKTLLFTLAVVGRTEATIVASSGPVVSGEWNSNLSAAVDKARAEHRPMLLVHVTPGCSFCARLNRAIDGEAFRIWQKDRSLLMVYRRAGSKDPQYQESRNFINSNIEGALPGFPFVCIYWPKADGTTNCVAFAGRHGEMCKDGKFKLFSEEFMTAVDHVLKDYLALDSSHASIERILANSVMKIACDKEGAEGTVGMDPPTGLLPEGARVFLNAKPAAGALFVGWKDPSGVFVGWKPQLEVVGSMPSGKYIAVFRKPEDCQPPVFVHTSTSLCVQVKKPFHFRVPLNDSSRPAHFRAPKHLPRGLKLDKVTGYISGFPGRRNTSDFVISVEGSDPAHTVSDFSVRLTVQP